MGKRLHMTGADYLAIAISPVLIMALVGSLVFFLIEVFYVGQYQARVNYVFFLFVFATVLIARISIEYGAERALMYSLPLGLATFLVLARFVEHPSPLSPLINLTVIAVVWWCAHKLTWDCTLIDDSEDASGEGLMQRIGVDETEAHAEKQKNELLDDELLEKGQQATRPWWSRLTSTKTGPHPPGLWVLYFSLAALPLFGLGQQWIPASDLASRRHAFGLLVVYVAAALSLLVTTSFLGLRRYLRQRGVEMPDPMAATWITVGAVLIAFTMMFAALLPRPAAEVAISQTPWQAGTDTGLSSSRQGWGTETTEEHDETGQPTAEEQEPPSAVTTDDLPDAESTPSDEGDASGEHQEHGQPSSADEQAQAGPEDSATEGEPPGERPSESPEVADTPDSPDSRGTPAEQPDSTAGEAVADEPSAPSRMIEHINQSRPLEFMQNLGSLLGGLAGLLKLLFYAVVAIALLVLMWRYRRQLLDALADILREIRLLWNRLFGVADTAPAGEEPQPTRQTPRRRFADYADPFATGKARQASPAELVRYSFDAFAAWAADRGFPRSPDQTPRELVSQAVQRDSPLHSEAHRLVQLYSELAYANRKISRESAEELRSLWYLMQSSN